MKSILTLVFIIVSLVLYCQNINNLEKKKAELNSSKLLFELSKKNNDKYYDSIFTKMELEKKSLEVVKSQLTKTQDSLNKLIEPFGVSQRNLNIYYLLKNEKIIDPNSNKYDNYYKNLNKAFNFSEDQKFLVITKFVCLEKLDENGRVSSFEKIKLSLDQIEKQNKLLAKNSLSIFTENNQILENLTGVNSKYLVLNNQLNVINDKLKPLISEIKRNVEQKENIYLEFEQKKINNEKEIDGKTKLINEIDVQITQINEQISAEATKTLNYSKFKTKKVNGVEVCTAPLYIREFRNGDEIKKARTKGEWDKFNELNIPAYHFRYFADDEADYGFIYNYYAIIDNRELAPYGFHKLNLIDLNYLEDQPLFTETKLVDCYCGDGTEDIHESCTNCNYWTEPQRKYTVCSKCQNRRYFDRGSKKCSSCNGTKKVKAFNMVGRNFCVFPSSTNKVEYFPLGAYQTPEVVNLLSVLRIGDKGKCENARYPGAEFIYGRMENGMNGNGYQHGEFQVLICKDREIKYLDTFQYTKIGDIEIMNTLLNVTKFRNGDPIEYIVDPIEWELALKNKIPAYCFFNNINDGKGCIYNIHAQNDKRGLMPLNWRSCRSNDITNMALTLNHNFSLNSAQSPIKPPRGFRKENGDFETVTEASGNSNSSSYIWCVRDAGKSITNNQSLKKNFNKSYLTSASKLLKKTDKFEDKYFDFNGLAKGGCYHEIYNDEGLKLIDNLVSTNFEELFDKNGELRIIAMDVRLFCESISCCGYTEYLYEGVEGDDIFGFIIKKSPNNNSTFTCSAIIANTSRYDPNFEIIESGVMKWGEFLWFSFKEVNISFCFSQNKCHPSDNPIDNFFVIVNNKYFGINTTWYNEVKSYLWGDTEDWALEQVLEFMNTH